MLRTESIWGDLRMAFRLSTKHFPVKAVVVVTLALGIGANSAMYTVIDAMLFRRSPYPHAEQLVLFQAHGKNGNLIDATSYPRFQELKNSSSSFEGIAGSSTQNLTLSGQGEAEPLVGELVSAEYFSVLRVNPDHGRIFTKDETSKAGSSPLAILSNGLWKRRFSGDTSVIGKTIQLNEQPFTVIGVLPPGFVGVSEKANVWIPITMIGVVSTPQLLENRVAIWVSVVGRLNADTPMAAAQTEMDVISRRRTPESLNPKQDRSIKLALLDGHNKESYREALLILFGSVMFVLLIACVNVANLLLSYFSDRKAELAVRNALGASRSRLVQQLLLESLVLALYGGVLGLMLAYLAVLWLGRGIISVLPALGHIEINAQVLLFTLLVSMLAGLVAGLLPLMQVVKGDLAGNLRNQARSGSGLSRSRLRTALVICQMSLAVVLLVAAGLMLRSMLNLQNVNAGFRSDHLLVARLAALPGSRYATPQRIVSFYQEILEKIGRMPQVRAVGAATSFPLISPSPSIPFTIRGRPSTPEHPATARYIAASADYFSALGMSLIQGRTLAKEDSFDGAPVVIINESAAKEYWPGENPIGQYLTILDGGPSRAIVGVVGDVRDLSLSSTSISEFYIPYQQIPSGFASILRSFPPILAIRTSVTPELLANSTRQIINEADPNEAVLDTISMERVLSTSIAQPRLYTDLLLVFAGIALLLAAIGIYGVMSYSVTQRTQEIGVRLALGATRESIQSLIVKQGMTLIGIGVILGVAGAWTVSRVLQNLLFQIKPADPVSFVIAASTLVGVAFLSSYIPARRASMVEPNAALKHE